MQYPHILAHLLDTPLWAHPVKAAVIYNVLAGRMGSGQYGALALPDVPDASRFVGDWPTSEDNAGHGRRPRTEPFRLTPAGVGIVTVTGSLVTRGPWIGSHSGLTSYEGIKHQLQRAAADKRVKSIILDLDTPGGEANGAFEAAQSVRHAAERKPVIALANGMAASAGYALASGATKLITTPSAISGSIGCVLLHLDHSRALENEGIRPTLITAGAHKTDGNALEPLTDETLAALQREVNRYYELFIETVAAGRGRTTPASVARNTEGRTFVGREAVAARLADDVGTFEEVLSDLTRRASRPVSSSSTQARRENMEPLFEDDKAETIEAVEKPEHGPTLYADKLKEEAPRIRLDEESTIADGEMIQLARFRAISKDARVKGKEAFALKLACEAPDLSADAVGTLCEEIPATSSRLSLVERMRETGVEGISSGPVPEDRTNKKTWDAAIAKTNERTLTQVKRR